MNKNILLAAAALSVLATAGAANAASITARAGLVSVTPSSPYTLARELNYSAGITSNVGQFDTVVTANNALTPGTYTVTLTYSGATINAAVPTAAITQPAALSDTDAAGFEEVAPSAASAATLTLSSGGTVGANSVSYTLQVPAGGSVQGVYFAPALKVNGAVSVTASIVNQVTGQPVDPSVIQPLITTTAQGFAAAATADTTNTDIVAGTAAPRFRTLSADTTIGTVGFKVASAAGVISATAPAAYRDLNGTTVSAADVTGANIVVSGSLTNLNLTASTGTVTKSGNTATIVQATPAASTTIGLAVIDAANGAQLSPSSYTVSGSYTLASAFSSALPFSTTALETVDTEGLTYVVPWVSSRTQGAATGSRTVIRMSRVGTNVTSGGNVYAQILNPLRGTANTNYALVGTLPAGSGELVLSSDTLENAFGDFGRADIRLAVTPTNGAGYTGFTPGITNNLIVKRVIAQPNGGVSEMEVVSVGAVGSANPTVGF